MQKNGVLRMHLTRRSTELFTGFSEKFGLKKDFQKSSFLHQVLWINPVSIHTTVQVRTTFALSTNNELFFPSLLFG